MLRMPGFAYCAPPRWSGALSPTSAVRLATCAVDGNAGDPTRSLSGMSPRGRDASSPYRTQLTIAELKTPRSRRTLTLTAELLAALRQHHARQAEARIAAGALWRDHGLIFTTEIGTPIDPESFAHTFSRLCKKAGLGHWHPHELRHSGASLMLAQGTPLHVVSEVLGHASITITKDVYGHLVEGDKRAAAESMTGALFGASIRRRGSHRGSQGHKKSPSASGEGHLT